MALVEYYCGSELVELRQRRSSDCNYVGILHEVVTDINERIGNNMLIVYRCDRDESETVVTTQTRVECLLRIVAATINDVLTVEYALCGDELVAINNAINGVICSVKSLQL